MQEKKQDNLAQTFVIVPHDTLTEILECQRHILTLLEREKTEAKGLGDYISEKDAIKMLKRTSSWFWRMRDGGKLPFSKIGSAVYYKKEDILHILKGNQTPAVVKSIFKLKK